MSDCVQYGRIFGKKNGKVGEKDDEKDDDEKEEDIPDVVEEEEASGLVPPPELAPLTPRSASRFANSLLNGRSGNGPLSATGVPVRVIMNRWLAP